tara:strand:- start:1715 stop:2461 length:747 start_codon:yes stop_codon:yes gene_type:complete
MAKNKVYPIPPITEAVVEFRFEDRQSASSLETLNSKFAKFYENEQRLTNQTVTVEIAEDKIQTESNMFFRRSNAAEDQICMLFNDKIAISQLAVYPGWDIFFARLSRDWAVCRKFWGYRKLTRIGMRFINRIDVPEKDEVCTYEEFLNVHIALPSFLDPSDNYALRVEKKFNDPISKVIINSAPIASPFPNCGAFLLDLDLGCTEELPQKDELIFDLLTKMRHLKNSIFEASITNKTRERLDDGIWLQ